MTEENIKTEKEEQDSLQNETKVETQTAINNDQEASAENASENQIENEQDQASEESEELSPEKIEIKRLEQELEEKQNRLLRLQADFENYRRRVRLDQEAAMKYRAQSLIENLLPVLDNFERALNIEVKEEETKQLLKGMEMVYRQLQDALKTEGLNVIEAVGKEFDPNYHHAVMQVNDSNYESNVVVEELQKGYILKDRVIRPTMVKVNQ
ncbi:nucleotide exchange factor GrpE [Bacillus sp. P2(2020)]|uniref:Protein GrpE n=2 Tax=Calidifontibacillus erzurumensis TaxID=2741433 RepID=A0A8J8K9Z0_9BACI|nr:nucleotide exchange factor GrpE [Calidifontibacillus erzurumensis]